MVRSFAAILGLGLLAAGAAVAQDSATAAQAAEWQIFSRSSRTAYLVDSSTLALVGDTTSVRTARAPFAPGRDDAAWSIEEIEFRCAAGQYRIVSIADFNADGSPAGPSETVDEAFDGVVETGLSGYLKGVVCDGQRASPPYYPTIQAWIAAGRK